MEIITPSQKLEKEDFFKLVQHNFDPQHYEVQIKPDEMVIGHAKSYSFSIRIQVEEGSDGYIKMLKMDSQVSEPPQESMGTVFKTFAIIILFITCLMILSFGLGHFLINILALLCCVVASIITYLIPNTLLLVIAGIFSTASPFEQDIRDVEEIIQDFLL